MGLAPATGRTGKCTWAALRIGTRVGHHRWRLVRSLTTAALSEQLLMPTQRNRRQHWSKGIPRPPSRLHRVTVGAQGDHLGRIVRTTEGQIEDVIDL